MVGIEPNPYLIDTLLEKQKSHPELVRVIRGYAEDLADIQDESIDAVVSTLVLCSVRDVDKAVQEAKRVLVKVVGVCFDLACLGNVQLTIFYTSTLI